MEIEGGKLMKKFYVCAALLMIVGMTFSIYAQDPQSSPRKVVREGRGGRLKQMDANNDGQISREEWTGKPQGFERFDENKDGVISREEFAAARKNAAEGRIKQLDANNDQRISREEWKGEAAAFDRLDANQDGYLTLEELRARRRKR
jgi:hypothetical protein